ncbi:MAG TPA: FAD-dependent oxidoreductase [Syntrophales bacterium]|nr:FAD-dependent oxidoreductase [Syntrophales bacterium]
MNKPTIIIPGMEKGLRVDSRILEERIQTAVAEGHRFIEIIAQGQHGIGGRLWRAGSEPVIVRVMGTSGQRLGSMGFPNTTIDVVGPASDDVGWLNAGAHITVRGNATNGVGNAMAQGKIFIDGDIGARGMTMTKYNPRFEPPELWVLGSVGDSFAEFMAGGVAVVCGWKKEAEANILGYRPCAGMVGGRIFFRGHHQGYCEDDVQLTSLEDEDWQWLSDGMKGFLAAIGKEDLHPLLLEERGAWRLLGARRPHEKARGPARTLAQFRRDVWEKELGTGGLIGDLSDLDRRPIPVITTGELRRFVPVWENEAYLAPCQANCPTGIPVRKRWELLRKGDVEGAVNLALEYTPFPAAVCGYLCPNLCMQNCTRQKANLPAVDTRLLGKASLEAKPPEPAPATAGKIAVIGGGAAGLSVAWQLYLKGYKVVLHDVREKLGGKMTETIPRSRIPDEVLDHELERLSARIPHKRLRHSLTEEEFLKLKKTSDFVVIAVGARKPRIPDIPGIERAVPALTFLADAKCGETAPVGKSVVVIGAGNVGCDAAGEAVRLGAESVTLIDIQEPASYGAERRHAEAVGAKFLWPRFTRTITEKTVELTSGESLPADTVIIAVGDAPDLSFVPESVAQARGFLAVNDRYQTSDPQVFAVGDAVKLGLLTEAIGAGRIAAETIDAMLRGRDQVYDRLPAVDPARVKLEYYDPRADEADEPAACSLQCASCGACRDCGLCEQICPEQAIVRRELGEGKYEYAVREDRCIGCGFCAGACPCGIWRLMENKPLE